jgi:hypothetical protein
MRSSFQSLSISLLLSSILFSSCVKNDDLCCGLENGKSYDALIGKWQLVEQKIGIGPPGEWKDVDNGEQFEFFSDLTFSSTTPTCASGTFILEDNILKFYCGGEKSLRDFTIVKFTGSSMTLTPASVICTEGCLFRYEKIQ